MPKHFFFDLDNTLTRSRTHIEPEHAALLQKLAAKAAIIAVSGAVRSQLAAQLEPEMADCYFALGQNGNAATMPDGSGLWEQVLSSRQKNAILALLIKMKAHMNLNVKDEKDLIEDRGCQISYSLIGHHEHITVKEAFDPSHERRLTLLKVFADEVKRLAREENAEIRSGGTTCLDIFEKGKNKGFNCKQLIERMNWKIEDCIYIGDALFPGGNDETVIGVIPTHAVKNYHETYAYLSSILV